MPHGWGQDQRKQHRVERFAVSNSGTRRLTKLELREVVAYLERKVANKSDTLDVDQIRLRYCRKLLYQQSDD